MSSKDRLTKIALPVLIILLAVAITTIMIKLKKQPPKRPSSQRGALVEVLPATRQNYPLELHASGIVEASRQISLEPQVSGKVVALGKNFASGTFFRKGDVLLQIEQADYILAVDQADAALARAEVELATTESQAAIAREEWERLSLQGDEEPNPLALFEPQLKNARANVTSAKASLAMARLNLERTTLRAPFDLRIRNEKVDLGQFVRAGMSIATLAATREAEVLVSLPLEDLVWLEIPDARNTSGGSRARVTLEHGSGTSSWQGIIARSLGEVDRLGRMMQVAVTVDDPYRLKQKGSRPPYLEVGMFVNLSFAGPHLKDVIVLPRRALRDSRSVWLAGEDNLLSIRPVEILRLEKENVIIESGLEEGDQVILTTLTGAADGMLLRIAGRE